WATHSGNGTTITAFSAYVAMPGATATDNVVLSATTTVSANTTINSLKLAGFTLNVNAGVTLTINNTAGFGGGILGNTGSGTINGPGTLAIGGSGEAVFLTNTGTTTTPGNS